MSDASSIRPSIGEGDTTAVRLGKIALGVLATIVLSPIAGMVLVFAVMPALPIALAVGAVLGPMNLFNNGEAEEEEERWRLRELHEAHAH
jgi:hypothetical protein